MIHETEIRYAITSDGVRIAYRAFGQGLPVVVLHPHAISHLEREWEIRPLRSWYERLGEQVQVVRMSHRGFGLSEGDASFVTLDDFVRDLEAVIGALGATQVGFVASGIGTPAAVAYADELTRKPDGVADATFEELRRHWDERQVVEITATAALFNSFNRFNTALGDDLTVYPKELG